MSNLIFCNVNENLCKEIYNLTKGYKCIVDVGCGRGFFASEYEKYLKSNEYKQKVRAIDLFSPDVALFDRIEEIDSRIFCFPKSCVPIFIRPCHSDEFLFQTILTNRPKFDFFIYVSKPENLSIDLDDVPIFEYEQVSNWIGDEGERMYRVNVKKDNNIYKWLSGKIVYFADPMLSFCTASIEEEFNINVVSMFQLENILVDGSRLTISDIPTCLEENFDILFFDYGGMSIGNSCMERFCIYIANIAKDFPSKKIVVVSTLTEYAMRDAIDMIGEEIPNIYFGIKDFVSRNGLEE